MRCAIIAFFLTCVSFAQTDIEIIQFSASFVNDKEISLKGFRYDTKTIYMSSSQDIFKKHNVKYIPTANFNMRTLITFILFFVVTHTTSQNLFEKIYKDLFKYSTVYIAGDIDNPKENPKDYFVRTNPNGNLYSAPVVVDGTDYYDFDYRYGFGIRKLDGTENNIGLSATNSAVNGLEYTFHFEKERSRDEVFINHRYFLKHSGKYHVVKLESRKQGRVDFNYKSAELRAKLPIGKKFSISGGAIYRTHIRPYGYNPVEIWLNETNSENQIVNPWYTLGFQYGYDDIYYTQEDQFGNEVSDWYWIDPEGEIVAHTDLEFRV